ncbi:MAG: ABC transporter substrate-binding protein, partial [Tagaea sp.]|nr:ABC transporter substrate-binding protein [Tagaea sp.]
MRKNLIGVIALAGAMAFAGGARAQMLELAVDGSPAGLDPHIVTAFNSTTIVGGTIYEALTTIDKDLRTVPGLAESWRISPDNLTYTFTLRAGVVFHDGKPAEAADVVASLKRVMSPAIASPLASRVASVADATAPDARTVVVTLKEPTAPLLTALASIAIVPRGFEGDKDGLQRAPMGTGPFRFKEWQPNGFVALEKNANYWDRSRPRADGVKFNIVPESATRQVG